MKKFFALILVLSLAWLAKLSFDFYQLSGQFNQQQQTLLQSEQRNASLNDQVVALQRVQTEPTTVASAKEREKTKASITNLNPSLLVQQELDLVQFALQQQQFVYAVEKLVQLNQNLDHYEIADSLKASLHQAIDQDQQSIQQFLLSRHAQEERLVVMLEKLDQRLKSELNNQQITPSKVQTQYFWQKWLQIERVETKTVQFDNRSMIFREAQFRLVLAQQALLANEFQSYQNMLKAVIQLFDALPDPVSQEMKQQVIQIKQTQMSPVPKLKSRTILG